MCSDTGLSSRSADALWRYALPPRFRELSLNAALLLLFLLPPAGILGCAPKRTISPTTKPLRGVAPAAADERAESVRRDPLAYLERVAEKCASLEQYTLMFTRQERRGLFFKMLREPERIACKFRREPFSVYMRWLDPEIKYGETTYVEGQQDNKVRFVPRHGLFGLPPRVTCIEPQTAVIWGEALYPITDFGLERLMARTLRNVKNAGGDLVITYEGLTQIGGIDRPVHYIRLAFPPSQFRVPIQELYIDIETDLPVCTRVVHATGELERAYVWADVDPNVTLTDDDFMLEAERDPSDDAEQSAATVGTP